MGFSARGPKANADCTVVVMLADWIAQQRVPLLTAGIVAGYIASLWWLLRGERQLVRVVLLAFTVAALVLRVIAFEHFPPGMHEDEPKVLACALDALRGQVVHREGCTGLPLLLNVLFQAQLVPWLGPDRWSMRLYPIATGTASVAAAYGVARALTFGVGASLVVAALVATLPWSLYYGRIAFGAEMTFHQLLLLGGLARIVFQGSGMRAALVAAFGQTLLLYDYFAGQLFLPFSLLVSLLARGWRRWLVLTVPCLAVAAWLPYLMSGPEHLLAPRGLEPHLEWHRLWEGARAAFGAFLWPVGVDGAITVRSAAMHPLPVLVLAVAGGLCMW